MKENKIKIQNLNVYYNYVQAVNDISMDVFGNRVTSIIGPSGCGKTSLLRTINRMNDLTPGFRMTGEVFLDDVNVYDEDVDVVRLRKKVGMVFQTSNLFPKSIYDNLTFAPRLEGIKNKTELDEIVEDVCRKSFIWNEVKDRLNENALILSAGQQQRLCIARSLAVKPDVLLMDEPATALDPISTAKIEELILELKQNYTIIVVTHNLQQAARISDFTAYLYLGQLVEYDKTTRIYTNPKNKQTEDYITGRFG